MVVNPLLPTLIPVLKLPEAQANRSTRPQEKYQQRPTEVHGSRAGACWAPPAMSLSVQGHSGPLMSTLVFNHPPKTFFQPPLSLCVL